MSTLLAEMGKGRYGPLFPRPRRIHQSGLALSDDLFITTAKSVHFSGWSTSPRVQVSKV